MALTERYETQKKRYFHGRQVTNFHKKIQETFPKYILRKVINNH